MLCKISRKKRTKLFIMKCTVHRSHIRCVFSGYIQVITINIVIILLKQRYASRVGVMHVSVGIRSVRLVCGLFEFRNCFILLVIKVNAYLQNDH